MASKMKIDKNRLLLGSKNDSIHVQTNRKKKIFINKTSKITRKHKQFYSYVSIHHMLCD